MLDSAISGSETDRIAMDLFAVYFCDHDLSRSGLEKLVLHFPVAVSIDVRKGVLPARFLFAFESFVAVDRFEFCETRSERGC